VIELNKIYLGDCLEGMKAIPAKSVDMILCDLPYGTTACKWDTIIPFAPLWEQYERVIKDNGAIVLTASQPFTSALVMSNPKLFKYEWIWKKTMSTGFVNAKIKPLSIHETVLVFGRGRLTYNPIKTIAPECKIDKRKTLNNTAIKEDTIYNFSKGYIKIRKKDDGTRFPVTVQVFANPNNGIHPTQKPVPLFEYLIKTYTNEGETVLDNCMGSGTTAIACINTNRNYIGFEKDDTYHALATERVRKHTEVKSISVPDLFSQAG
jgi:site-specific DNA-methyltransferase (adenine-specific)